MRHSTALKIIRDSLAKIDPALEISLVHQTRLPSSPKTEAAYWLSAGPGKLGDHIWVKNGRLQQTEAWDPYPYTYWDLDDPIQIATWAKARKSLIRNSATIESQTDKGK